MTLNINSLPAQEAFFADAPPPKRWIQGKADGIDVSVSTVGSIMRAEGLRAIRTRAWCRTTVADPDARTAHIESLWDVPIDVKCGV